MYQEKNPKVIWEIAASLDVYARPLPYYLYALYIASPNSPPQKKCPFGDLILHLIDDFLQPPDPPRQTASRSSQPFFHNTNSLPTDRRTDRQNDNELDRYQRAACAILCATRANKLPTTLARELMQSPPSVCPSVRPAVSTLTYEPSDL